MLFHISAFSIVVIIAFGLYHYRQRLLPYLPSRLAARLANYVPLSSSSFSDQVAAGMTSSSFDVEAANLGDTTEGRSGLDERGVEEVRRIMAIERCTFDQARLIRHNRHLRDNGIAPDGTPLDSKAVTFGPGPSRR